jgi:hypothetical protein
MIHPLSAVLWVWLNFRVAPGATLTGITGAAFTLTGATAGGLVVADD